MAELPVEVFSPFPTTSPDPNVLINWVTHEHHTSQTFSPFDPEDSFKVRYFSYGGVPSTTSRQSVKRQALGKLRAGKRELNVVLHPSFR